MHGYLASRGSPIFGQPQLWAEFGLETARVARRGDACVPQLKLSLWEIKALGVRVLYVQILTAAQQSSS